MSTHDTENINDILEYSVAKRNFITVGTVVMNGLCLYSCVIKFINATGINRDVIFSIITDVIRSYLNDFTVSPTEVRDQLNRNVESGLWVSDIYVRALLICIEQDVHALLMESDLHRYRRGSTIIMHDEEFLRIVRVDINTPIPTIIVSLCEWSPTT